MDRFHTMQVFVAVAETQGFAAASRRLNLSPPAVTRAISALEESLGVVLLQRTTRHVRLTEVGQRYLEDSKRILADLRAANEAVTGMVGTLRGQIAVTAPVLFGRLFVAPAVVAFLECHPEIEMNLLLLDRVVNLLEEGMDVGVRIGQLEDSTLHAIPVGQVYLLTLASPSYLSKHGNPQKLEDLLQHQLISTRGVGPQAVWRFGHLPNEKAIRISARLTVNNNQAALEAATQGFGIVRMLSYQVDAAVEKGDLVPVLTQYMPAERPIHILHRGGRFTTAKVRAFIDALVEKIRNQGNLQRTID